MNSSDLKTLNSLQEGMEELNEVKHIADIANIKANVGINKSFDTKQLFASINLRANYVGGKKWVTVQQYLPTQGSIIHLKDMSTTLMMEGLDLKMPQFHLILFSTGIYY